MRVRNLVAYLDERLPFAWAQEWDRVGLLAGDPQAEVTRVFLTLDATASTIERAVAADASVLLTHHPAFLDPLPGVVAGAAPGDVVFRAVTSGVALIACHTNLDRAPSGSDALPDALGLGILGPLEPEGTGAHGSVPRMGRVCDAGGAATLGQLASRVASRLGVRPRVWGPADSVVRRVATAQGSGRSLVTAAREAGADVMITGELGYHGAHDALETGLLVIEAGHDATEWPLTRVLATIASEAPGAGPDTVVLDDVTCPWWTA